ncbi:MAG: hypothetical protein NWF13_07780, partial [Candidatus Bathyarchaeota archaeon]|nr:hypothetical protein [Candidatus Bathyarchaeota archaeon]
MTFFEYDPNLNFLSELKENISGSTSENRRKRIEGLIELHKRIGSNSFKDENEVIQILLEFADIRGKSNPESKLIIESLFSLVQKDDKNYQIILTGLKEQENRLLVFSKLILELNNIKKREGIKPLVDFLMSRGAINDSSVSEVKSCLINLGNENFSTEIIKEVTPFLDSLNICQIVFSTELCAIFANEKLLKKLLIVLERSIDGFFSGHEDNIEENICRYLDRIANPNSLFPLLKLLKLRKSPDNYVNKAIA